MLQVVASLLLMALVFYGYMKLIEWLFPGDKETEHKVVTLDKPALEFEKNFTDPSEQDLMPDSELPPATCIGCGCDDLHACPSKQFGSCYWLRVDRDLGVGVCSGCPFHLQRWDNGERSLV